MLEILCARYGIAQVQGGPPTTAAQALGLVENLFDYSDTTTESSETLSDLSGFSTGSAKAAELLNEVRQLHLRAMERSAALSGGPGEPNQYERKSDLYRYRTIAIGFIHREVPVSSGRSVVVDGV